MERIASNISVIISISEVIEVALNVMPITKEDDKVHKYQIPLMIALLTWSYNLGFFASYQKLKG